jgi:hypothetical protein
LTDRTNRRGDACATAVFVLSSHTAAELRDAGLDAELQRLLGVKVWVTTESDAAPGRTVPF